MSLFSAQGLVVVVTGGGTGIGLAMTSALHNTAAKKVYILGRRLEVLTSAAESLDKANQIVTPIQCDVSDPASIASAVKYIEKDMGYIDVLINNAGISGPDHRSIHNATSIADIQKTLLSDWSGWEKTFDINTSSVVGVSAAFLHLLDAGNSRRGFETGKMSSGGQPRKRKTVEGVDQGDIRSSQIITVGSIAAYNRYVTAGLSYSASKAGAVALGKALSYLLAPWGIRSNVICPGLFPSEMTAGGKADFPYNEVPAHRQGTNDEITGTVLYMVGKSGGYLNGSVQVIDGGRLAVMPSTY